MVPPRHPKNRAPTASPEDSGQRKYRTSLIETHGIQLAGESQAAGIGKQQSAAATGTPPAIYLYRSPAQAISRRGPTPLSASMPRRRSGSASSRTLGPAGNS